LGVFGWCNAAVGVDHQPFDTRTANSLQLLDCLNPEIAPPERMIEPRPFKGVDEHTDFDVLWLNSNKHYGSRCGRLIDTHLSQYGTVCAKLSQPVNAG